MLWSALTLGLLGSFHCIGMCGPIAISLPFTRQNGLVRYSGGLVYNLGRVFTYILLGAIFGLFGKGIAMAGFQQTLSIVLGVLILLSVIAPVLIKKKINPALPISRLVAKLKTALGSLMRQKSFSSLFLIGILNGFLPCGLVYIAIAGATAASGFAEGAIYMALFGLGTIPAMYAMSIAGNMIGVQTRNKIMKAVPYFIAIIGILFIIRGLNLGIPYLSPEIAPESGEVKVCH